ncbi:MAG: hypothetical protein QXH91_04860 [Candidatus Bathyarchaeia archaeon]
MSDRRSVSIIIVSSFMIIWVALMTLALTWETMYVWPDYVHADYGLPFTWATHTLNTIAGPVDKWRVNLSALLTDLFFWLGIMIAAVAIILYFVNKEKA